MRGSPPEGASENLDRAGAFGDHWRSGYSEREEIGLVVAEQEPIRPIAKRLDRAMLTVSREIKRNRLRLFWFLVAREPSIG